VPRHGFTFSGGRGTTFFMKDEYTTLRNEIEDIAESYPFLSPSVESEHDDYETDQVGCAMRLRFNAQKFCTAQDRALIALLL